ncbi:MAG: helix-turn-helix transcriptional regulator [Candidatus Poribacteria bacterium]|nr:helix-turn-helix transcriptional regulator [Candidatus Poribacteria bacterium]
MMTLKEARRRKGLTQTRLAGESGVAPNLLGFAERGRFRLSQHQARRIAVALHVQPEEVDELKVAVDEDARRIEAGRR